MAACKWAEREVLLRKGLGLAVSCESGQSVRQTKEEEEKEMGAKKILLVDDSSTARLVTRLIFSQKSNYVLLSAVDGKDAVERAHAEKPDLILMDVMMPRMTGLEACRVLKHDKETSKIPVILLTTRAEEQYVQEGYESGCSDYLTKPVNDTELLDLLKAYLGE
jgi:CheY-like chemotaxis protein